MLLLFALGSVFMVSAFTFWFSIQICLRSVQYKRSHSIGLRVFFVRKTGACRRFSPLCPANGSFDPVTDLCKRRKCCRCLGVTFEFREICLDESDALGGAKGRFRFRKSKNNKVFQTFSLMSVAFVVSSQCESCQSMCSDDVDFFCLTLGDYSFEF